MTIPGEERTSHSGLRLPGEEPVAFLRRAEQELHSLHAGGAGGLELARRRANLIDLVLISRFRHAEHSDSASGRFREAGLAVVAVGGYGRRELCPKSDIDLMVLYRSEQGHRVREIAEKLFYPLWDAGLELGHGARTVEESLEVASDNIEPKTSLLQARLLVGDQHLFQELRSGLRTQVLADGAEGLIDRIGRERRARHETFGPASALVEPHLKEGRGGLRDIHDLVWAAAALEEASGLEGLLATEWLNPEAGHDLREAADVLLRARASLHLALGRKVDRVHLDYQEDLARQEHGGACRTEDITASMNAIYRAAEAVAVLTGGVWDELSKAAERERHGGRAGPQAAVRPRTGSRSAAVAVSPETPRERGRYVLDLLANGEEGVLELEKLSHQGTLGVWIPGWEGIRSLAQRDGLHTYTVGGHSLRCAATACRLARAEPDGSVGVSVAAAMAGTDRWDAVLLACLLHDVGKASAAKNHAEAGVGLAARALAGLGVGPGVRDDVEFLVRNHLVLAETAARRDLDDPQLLRRLSAVMGDSGRLEMLYVLTVADSIATGPAVWTPWTAALVRELFFKLLRRLEKRGETVSDVAGAWEQGDGYPVGAKESVYGREMTTGGEGTKVSLEVKAGSFAGVEELWVVSPHVDGLLARVSGVLAYRGLNILSAQIRPLGKDLVEQRFLVVDEYGTGEAGERWSAVTDGLLRAFEGRLALEYRLADKAARYESPRSSERREEAQVVVENQASESLTVIEVHAVDRVGLLYTLARTLDDLRLQVHLAKVSTMKDRVIDVFYVSGLRGEKIEDREQLAEVERAVLFALGRQGTESVS